MKGLQDFGVYQEISEEVKVIDSGLVIKEEADGCRRPAQRQSGLC